MLKIIQTAWGRFELAFDDPALADDDAAVATMVYAALATDAEAPEHREADRYFRRGWWADPAAGTGLWHVRRQPLNAEARAETLAMIRRALAKAAPALTDIAVKDGSAPENVSSLLAVISGRHHGREFLIKVPL